MDSIQEVHTIKIIDNLIISFYSSLSSYICQNTTVCITIIQYSYVMQLCNTEPKILL